MDSDGKIANPKADGPLDMDWVAVDWGTSHLRAWAMAANTPVGSARADRGMSALAPDQFEAALLDLVDPWIGNRRMTVMACGMIGARQGWHEVPYRAVPCAVDVLDPVPVPARDKRLDIRIVPGLSQMRPADVMRGEETQIAGFLTLHPKFDGVLCLPGTHTKWVHISAGEVVSFRTFMTGELFGLLAKQSVLRHSLGSGWDDSAFVDATGDAMARPEAVAARLFSLRAESLLSAADPGRARAQVSGLLIGMELAAARPYWLGRDIGVIGTGGIAEAYCKALAAQGLAARRMEGEDMTIRGLSCARQAVMTKPAAPA